MRPLALETFPHLSPSEGEEENENSTTNLIFLGFYVVVLIFTCGGAPSSVVPSSPSAMR